MESTVMSRVKAFTFVALGLAIAAMGIYLASADDAPGAAVIGMLLMAMAVVLGVRAVRNRLPVWAARTALSVGFVAAAFAAFLTHGVTVTAPLFAQSQEVPSVMGSAPSPQYAAAVERARQLVRAAVLDQNLPGVSVAVGAGLSSEAFAKEEIIGTAASAVTAAIGAVKLTNTGAEAAKEWSPEAIGEEGEDFPPLTLLRHTVLQPLGLAPSEYPLPGNRATFYVPRADNDPRRGRQLMLMRDLACCSNGLAFYSTPSDLVRVALAANTGDVNGELAGGMVMSLMRPDSGIVVAVTSNMAHANTSALALRIGDAFADHTR